MTIWVIIFRKKLAWLLQYSLQLFDKSKKRFPDRKSIAILSYCTFKYCHCNFTAFSYRKDISYLLQKHAIFIKLTILIQTMVTPWSGKLFSYLSSSDDQQSSQKILSLCPRFFIRGSFFLVEAVEKHSLARKLRINCQLFEKNVFRINQSIIIHATVLKQYFHSICSRC